MHPVLIEIGPLSPFYGDVFIGIIGHFLSSRNAPQKSTLSDDDQPTSSAAVLTVSRRPALLGSSLSVFRHSPRDSRRWRGGCLHGGVLGGTRPPVCLRRMQIPVLRVTDCWRHRSWAAFGRFGTLLWEPLVCRPICPGPDLSPTLRREQFPGAHTPTMRTNGHSLAIFASFGHPCAGPHRRLPHYASYCCIRLALRVVSRADRLCSASALPTVRPALIALILTLMSRGVSGPQVCPPTTSAVLSRLLAETAHRRLGCRSARTGGGSEWALD